MEMKDFNTWWIEGKIREDYFIMRKRNFFNELIKYIEDKQIISLTGLRRVGKTVLFHHIIQYLLEKKEKEKIFYFSFDLTDKSLEEVLNEYSEKLGVDYKKEKIFVFFDEIQKRKNWENELKILYDNYPNIKFFISGSASLFLKKKAHESLAGRVLSFKLEPLTFKEYLELKDVEIDVKKIAIYQDILKNNFEDYLICGGFPEVIGEKDKAKLSKYFQDLVMEKVIYIDIPSVFKVEEPSLLKELFKIISSSPGMILDYESLANDLKKNRKTISNYLSYLEEAFLIKKVYNYSGNNLTSEKKLKRFYPVSTAFCFLFDSVEIGKIVESSFLMNQDVSFFSRIGEKEIDFIIKQKKKFLPIEIKYRNEIKLKDFEYMKDFCKAKGVVDCVALTKGVKRQEKIDGVNISIVPIWNWFLTEDLSHN